MLKGSKALFFVLTGVLFLLILSTFLLCACSRDTELKDVKISVGNNQFVINDSSNLYFNSLSIEKPITFTTKQNGYELSVEYFENENSQGEKLSNNTITLDEIKRGAYFDLSISAGDKTISARLNLTKSDFPILDVTGQGSINGDYLFAAYSCESEEGSKKFPSYMLKVSPEGKIKYFRWEADYVLDFQKVITTDNQIRYLYFLADQDKFNETDYGLNAQLVFSKVVVMDENYNFIKDIYYKKANYAEFPIEMHDLVYFNDNHYIVASNEARLISQIPDYMEGDKSQPMKAVACLIQEVQDDNIVWEFDSTDYADFYQCYSKDMSLWRFSDQSIYKGYVDYMHINSMSIDPNDQNLIISFRNISSVVKINRTTGERMWVLGGEIDEFNLTDKFGLQHNAVSYIDGVITLFDNTKGETNYSRVMELKLDEQNKTVQVINTVDLGILCTACGSAEKVGNNYLVCFGVNTRNLAKIEEINPQTGKASLTIIVSNSKMLYNVNWG